MIKKLSRDMAMRVNIQNKKIFLEIIQSMFPDLKIPKINGLTIDSRNIIYFLSVIGFFLIMTVQSLESRRWS